jgi:NAD(P)-dependent dehydrogenase (short-subunit alcohol dehydrogenase family)
MKLSGRKALITGASQGLGAAIARAFVENGANVMLCARGEELLEMVREDLTEVAAGRSLVLAQKADVAKPADVDAVAARAISELGGLDILVCNAGVYGPKGPIEDVPWDEWVSAMNINIHGVVLPCRAVLRHFKAQKYGKIILLSGGGATKPLPFVSAYAASKAAVVRFGDTLAEEVAGFNIDVNSIAPGALNTRMVDEILAAGPEKVGQKFYDQNVKFKSGASTPLEKGAALSVYLASAESDGITGKLISAQWDPWADLAAKRQELKDTDIYTLRRIVPEDRGQKW